MLESTGYNVPGVIPVPLDQTLAADQGSLVGQSNGSPSSMARRVGRKRAAPTIAETTMVQEAASFDQLQSRIRTAKSTRSSFTEAAPTQPMVVGVLHNLVDA